MKYIFTFLCFFTILISCSRNEVEVSDNTNNTNEPLTTKMNASVFNDGSVLLGSGDNNIYFEYENNKLKKKIGGLVPISPNSGFTYYFTADIYTSLVYKENKVAVENFSFSGFAYSKNSIYYTLNDLDQIVQKEIPSEESSFNDKVQIFKYSGDKISEIVTNYPNHNSLSHLEKFYYDNRNNLIKIEDFTRKNGGNNGIMTIKFFEDYDNSKNPCKKFYLLDEYFYRSLSNNNFRKYREEHYENNQLISSSTMNWSFSYDSKGNIIIN